MERYHLELIRDTLRRRLGTMGLRATLGSGGLVALALLAYCLGHGLFTQEPVDLVASLRWSVAHAAGVGLMGVVGTRGAGRGWWVRWFAILAAGLLGSALAYAAIGLPGSIGWLHDYVAVTIYLGAAGLLAWGLAWKVTTDSLEIDFGTRRQLIRAADIIAVHGARNYVEIEVVQCPAPGLARTSLESLLARFPSHLVQTHRSHLVNPAAIAEVERASRRGWLLRLNNGSEVPVSSRFAKLFATGAFVPPSEISSRATGLSA